MKFLKLVKNNLKTTNSLEMLVNFSNIDTPY